MGGRGAGSWLTVYSRLHASLVQGSALLIFSEFDHDRAVHPVVFFRTCIRRDDGRRFLCASALVFGACSRERALLTEGLEFNSLIIGLVLGLTLGAVGRCNWSDIPRRVVTWFLVREQRFFYYALIAVCGGVLIFY